MIESPRLGRVIAATSGKGAQCYEIELRSHRPWPKEERLLCILLCRAREDLAIVGDACVNEKSGNLLFRERESRLSARGRNLEPDDDIDVLGPFRFLAPPEHADLVVAFTMGAGLVAMEPLVAEWSTGAGRKVVWTHLYDPGGDPFALSGGVKKLVAESEAVVVSHHNFPPEELRELLPEFDADGYFSLSLIRSKLPSLDTVCAVAGDAAFVQKTFDILIDLGVPPNLIRFEFVGSPRELRPTRLGGLPSGSA